MDCRTARFLLHFARPSTAELATSEVGALESHLADCPECAPVAHAEARIEEQIGHAVRDVPVPEGLRERLLGRLQARYRPWYRNRRTAGNLAAAAALLLAVWVGWGWFGKTRIDSGVAETLAYRTVNQIANPKPDEVQAWLHEKGINTAAPGKFDYTLLTFYDLADLQGKQVPLLLFIKGRDQARVYILDERRFAVSPDLFPRALAVGGSVAKVQAFDLGEGFAYIVVYTTDSLEPFQSEESRPAT